MKISYSQDWFIRQLQRFLETIFRYALDMQITPYEIIKKSNITKTDTIYKILEEMIDDLKLDDAEDFLFKNMENTKSYLFLSLDFYRKLLDLSDEDLAKGNFSKEEIEEGLESILIEFKINLPKDYFM